MHAFQVEKQQRRAPQPTRHIEPIPDSPHPVLPQSMSFTSSTAPSLEEQLKQKLNISPHGMDTSEIQTKPVPLSAKSDTDFEEWKRLLTSQGVGLSSGAREPEGENWMSGELLNPAVFESPSSNSVLQSTIDEQLRSLSASQSIVSSFCLSRVQTSEM